MSSHTKLGLFLLYGLFFNLSFVLWTCRALSEVGSVFTLQNDEKINPENRTRLNLFREKH